MKISAIYLITVARPGELPLYYVGQSVNVEMRRREHMTDLRCARHRNAYMQNAANKYGADAVRFEILEECPPEGLDCLEQWWIDAMHGHERCMNIARDVNVPNRGVPASAATKAKISAANKGRVRTPEMRAKLSAARTGLKVSEAGRASQKGKNKGVPRPDHVREKIRAANKGKFHLTDEHRAALAEKARDTGSRPEIIAVLRANSEAACRPVSGTCLKTGRVVTYPSIAATASDGFTPQNIWQLLHVRGKSHRGYAWAFVSPQTSAS